MLLERWNPQTSGLARWDPFSDLRDTRREMDRLFGSLFGATPANSSRSFWNGYGWSCSRRGFIAAWILIKPHIILKTAVDRSSFRQAPHEY